MCLTMDDHPTLAVCIDSYLLRCELEGKSPATLRAYRGTMGRFLRALTEDDAPSDPRQIRPDHVMEYLRRFTHLSHETRHRYFREARCFFNWLVAAGYCETTPFRGIRNVRLPRKVVEPFTPTDILALLSQCDATGPVGKRDLAILYLLLDTGMRCGEVVGLDLADCNLESRRIRIRVAKGNKQRVVPFADRCHEALTIYIRARGTDPGPLLLLGRYGRLHAGVGLRPNGVKQLLRRLGRSAGVPKVHAHRFRHTFATWAIQQDARELDVQHLLGHASPDMVRRYTASYGAEQAALRHPAFSPADQMLAS